MGSRPVRRPEAYMKKMVAKYEGRKEQFSTEERRLQRQLHTMQSLLVDSSSSSGSSDCKCCSCSSGSSSTTTSSSSTDSCTCNDKSLKLKQHADKEKALSSQIATMQDALSWVENELHHHEMKESDSITSADLELIDRLELLACDEHAMREHIDQMETQMRELVAREEARGKRHRKIRHRQQEQTPSREDRRHRQQEQTQSREELVNEACLLKQQVEEMKCQMAEMKCQIEQMARVRPPTPATPKTPSTPVTPTTPLTLPMFPLPTTPTTPPTVPRPSTPFTLPKPPPMPTPLLVPRTSMTPRVSATPIRSSLSSARAPGEMPKAASITIRTPSELAVLDLAREAMSRSPSMKTQDPFNVRQFIAEEPGESSGDVANMTELERDIDELKQTDVLKVVDYDEKEQSIEKDEILCHCEYVCVCGETEEVQVEIEMVRKRKALEEEEKKGRAVEEEEEEMKRKADKEGEMKSMVEDEPCVCPDVCVCDSTKDVPEEEPCVCPDVCVCDGTTQVEAEEPCLCTVCICGKPEEDLVKSVAEMSVKSSVGGKEAEKAPSDEGEPCTCVVCRCDVIEPTMKPSSAKSVPPVSPVPTLSAVSPKPTVSLMPPVASAPPSSLMPPVPILSKASPTLTSWPGTPAQSAVKVRSSAFGSHPGRTPDCTCEGVCHCASEERQSRMTIQEGDEEEDVELTEKEEDVELTEMEERELSSVGLDASEKTTEPQDQPQHDLLDVPQDESWDEPQDVTADLNNKKISFLEQEIVFEIPGTPDTDLSFDKTGGSTGTESGMLPLIEARTSVSSVDSQPSDVERPSVVISILKTQSQYEKSPEATLDAKVSGSSLTPGGMVTALTPEIMAAALTPKVMADALTPEVMIAALTPEVVAAAMDRKSDIKPVEVVPDNVLQIPAIAIERPSAEGVPSQLAGEEEIAESTSKDEATTLEGKPSEIKERVSEIKPPEDFVEVMLEDKPSETKERVSEIKERVSEIKPPEDIVEVMLEDKPSEIKERVSEIKPPEDVVEVMLEDKPSEIKERVSEIKERVSEIKPPEDVVEVMLEDKPSEIKERVSEIKERVSEIKERVSEIKPPEDVVEVMLEDKPSEIKERVSEIKPPEDVVEVKLENKPSEIKERVSEIKERVSEIKPPEDVVEVMLEDKPSEIKERVSEIKERVSEIKPREDVVEVMLEDKPSEIKERVSEIKPPEETVDAMSEDKPTEIKEEVSEIKSEEDTKLMAEKKSSFVPLAPEEEISDFVYEDKPAQPTPAEMTSEVTPEKPAEPTPEEEPVEPMPEEKPTEPTPEEVSAEPTPEEEPAEPTPEEKPTEPTPALTPVSSVAGEAKEGPTAQALEAEALSPGVTVSRVQAAFKALQVKDHTKDRMIAALVEEVRVRGGGSKVWQHMLEEMARNDVTPPKDFDRTEVCNTLSRPKLPAEPTARMRKRNEELAERRPSRFRGDMDLRVVRRIPPDCLLISWTVPENSVLSGYEVYVNGKMVHRVRSAARTRALLYDIDLNKKMTLSVIAVTPNGRCVNVPVSIEYDGSKY